VISYDLSKDSPIDASGLIDLGFKAYLGVPIQAKGEILGTLCTFVKSVLTPAESNITVMEAIGQQVGVAIENTRLFAQTQATLAEVESIQRRYQIQAWSSYNQRQRSSGYLQNAEGLQPIGKQKLTEVEEVINKQTPLLSTNEEKPMLTVPIMLRDQPIGAVGLRAGRDKLQWTAEEIALVQEISEQFALAAESLRLLDETQRRAARERLVTEITTKLRATNDPQAMLQTAAQELREALRAKRTQIYVQKSEPAPATTEQDERGEA
jgi:GAF domain-containing protein